MDHGHNPQRLFIRCVGNQVIPFVRETQRALCQVRTAIASMGKRNQLFDGLQNIRNHPVGGGGVVVRDELPNVLQIEKGCRVKVVIIDDRHAKLRFLPSAVL